MLQQLIVEFRNADLRGEYVVIIAGLGFAWDE
jgi:hypothetical protein